MWILDQDWKKLIIWLIWFVTQAWLGLQLAPFELFYCRKQKCYVKPNDKSIYSDSLGIVYLMLELVSNVAFFNRIYIATWPNDLMFLLYHYSIWRNGWWEWGDHKETSGCSSYSSRI